MIRRPWPWGLFRTFTLFLASFSNWGNIRTRVQLSRLVLVRSSVGTSGKKFEKIGTSSFDLPGQCTYEVYLLLHYITGYIIYLTLRNCPFSSRCIYNWRYHWKENLTNLCILYTWKRLFGLFGLCNSWNLDRWWMKKRMDYKSLWEHDTFLPMVEFICKRAARTYT